jgi:hypothetical protein
MQMNHFSQSAGPAFGGEAWQSPESAWDAQIAAARDADRGSENRSLSWVPPIMEPLVRAAQSTGLRRLYPFTSHNQLRFGTAPPAIGGDNGSIAPIFIAVSTDPDRYVVYLDRGDLGQHQAVLETTSPGAAATEAERRLASWPNLVDNTE